MASETIDVEMQQKEFDEIVKIVNVFNSSLSETETQLMLILYKRLVMDYLYKYKHKCEKQFPDNEYMSMVICWCYCKNCSVK